MKRDWRKEFGEKFYQNDNGVWMSRSGESYGSARPEMGRGELFRFIGELYKDGDTHGALTRLYDCIEELETLTQEGESVEKIIASWKIRANAISTAPHHKPNV